jgi:basic membrane protein A
VKGKEAALALYGQGADVVFHAAGGSGLGLFRAAKEVSDATDTHVWAIGVDSDQYEQVLGAADEGEGAELQPFILTSMLKRVDVAVGTTILDFLEGNFTSGVARYSLAEDGVGYSTSGGFIDDIVPELEDYKSQIIDGTIVVPEVPEA